MKTQDFIYLDYAATTPIAPEVLQEMTANMTLENMRFANPSSLHYLGRNAKSEWQHYVSKIAEYLQCEADEILINSGATESINLALKGVLLPHKHRNAHLIISTVEHKATLQVAQSLMKEGIKVTFLRPNVQGQISVDDLEAAIKSQPSAGITLVSLIWVNNETGTIFDIPELAKFLRERKILFHVDATQAIPRLKINASDVDLLSMSAHKCYAPKGVGLLMRRNFPKIAIQAQIDGGGAQLDLRAGTYPVSQLVGLSRALQFIDTHRNHDWEQAQHFLRQILGTLSPLGVSRNGLSRELTPQNNQDNNAVKLVPSIINLHIPNVLAETLMASVPDLGFSAGSACSSQNTAPSHVLTELGLSNLAARQSIRLSTGHFTNQAQIDLALKRLSNVIEHLQHLSSGEISNLDSDVLAWHDFSYLPKAVYQRLCQPHFSPMPSKATLINQYQWQKNNDEMQIDIQIFKSAELKSKYYLSAALIACPYAIYLSSLIHEKLCIDDFKQQLNGLEKQDGRSALQAWMAEEQVIFPNHKLALLVWFEGHLNTLIKDYLAHEN